MEHMVIIEKLCSCAKKEGLQQVTMFGDKNEAQSMAKDQVGFMSQSFCGKHEFDVTEVNDHFVIGMIDGGCGCGTHEKH